MQSPTQRNFSLVKISVTTRVGCKEENCPELFLDTWKIENVEEYETGKTVLEDVTDDDHKIEKSEEERYLGDLISSDGRNSKNMKARKGKGNGIINQIMSFLSDVFFGPFYFQVAVMLRTTKLLSSILLNSESWYNLTDSDINELETVDNILLRKIL